MIKSRSNHGKISRALLIFSCVLLFHVVSSAIHQNNGTKPFLNEPFQPTNAQVSPSSISCDLTNGASFSAGGLKNVNWTITGYLGMRYVLIHNNISVDFGRITSNTSFVVRQEIGDFTSWQYCGVQIYNENTPIGEKYVTFEVKEGFWTFTTVILLASGSVVSIAITADVLIRRKLKTSTTRPDNTFPLTQTTSEILTDTDVLETLTPEEETEYTTISTTRVIRIWLWNDIVHDYVHKWVIREDLSDPKRLVILERELVQFINNLNLSGHHRTRFLSVVSMQESERLLGIPLNPPLILLLLFSGRITRSYMKLLQDTAIELKKTFATITIENLSKIFDMIDARLNVHHSRIYVEPVEETTQALRESQFPEIENDRDILEDARELTPPECREIVSFMKNLNTRRATDLMIDEVEDLSLELSKKQN